MTAHQFLGLDCELHRHTFVRSHLLTLEVIPSFLSGNGSGNAKKAAVVSTKSALENGILHIDTAQSMSTIDDC